MSVFNTLKIWKNHHNASMLSHKMPYFTDFSYVRQTPISLLRRDCLSKMFRQLLWHPKITYPHWCKRRIQQKFKFETPHFCYSTKNFNLIATVEDLMPGQYNFHTIIFSYQDHFSELLKKKMYEKSSNSGRLNIFCSTNYAVFQ